MSNESENRRSVVSASACEWGDNLLEKLIEMKLVSKEKLLIPNFHSLSDEQLEELEEENPDLDPSGFTEDGRELFEFMYNAIMGEHNY